MTWLWVGGGGVVGALLRFSLTKFIGERYLVSFPFATLLINVTGSFLLGLFTRYAGVWWPGQLGPMLLLGTGLCGAYTTFSTFTYEFTTLAREGRWLTALWYMGFSIVLGAVAAAIGLFGFPR